MTFRSALVSLALVSLPVGCSVAMPEPDSGGADARGDADRLDGAHLDGARGDGGGLDGGRYPDGALVHVEAGPEPIEDATIGDANGILDGHAGDAASEAGVILDASADGAPHRDGDVAEAGAWYPDGAPGLDDASIVFRPDATAGIPCGGSICAEGLTCCPITGICVPFGCGECCTWMPPPPPSF